MLVFRTDEHRRYHPVANASLLRPITRAWEERNGLVNVAVSTCWHSRNYATSIPATGSKIFDCWTASFRLRALLQMYEATGETTYLDRFITLMDESLGYRDHHQSLANYNRRCLPAWSAVPIAATWPYQRHYFPVDNGLMALGLAEFADHVVTDGLGGVYATKKTEYLTAFDEIATAIGEQWDDNAALGQVAPLPTTGPGFEVPSDVPGSHFSAYAKGKRYAWNYESVWAMAYLHANRAKVNATYLSRCKAILAALKDPDQGLIVSGSKYLWAYQSVKYTGAGAFDLSEDISHGNWTVQCAVKAYIYGIANGGTAYFTAADMAKLVASWKGLLYLPTDPTNSQLKWRIDGTVDAAYDRYPARYAVGWEFLVPYDSTLEMLSRRVASANQQITAATFAGAAVASLAWAINRMYPIQPQ